MLIYFMGICGTAMGNAALLIKEQGHEVLGCDAGVYPPMCDVLADAGIDVLEGFDAARLASLKPDQVVVGNAMSRGNPEVEWLLDQSEVAYISLPALFHDTVLPRRKPVVITGTHGKTTTSTVTAYLLEQAGAQPGWLIGGVPNDLSGGAKLGKGRAFVIEGDEYDSAFFDKRSKFIHYRPQVAVLNNLEFDHADIFRDLEDVQRTFRHLLRIIPSSGYALVNGDDRHIAELLPAPWTQVLRVGTSENNDLIIRAFKDAPTGAQFELVWRGKLWGQVRWPLHGLFNARNAAMGALAAALASGCSDPSEFTLAALEHFGGVRRRQDVLYTDANWTVLEDFAHHPTAVSGAIEALQAAYPDRTMTVCFEPRSNTAASSQFQVEFEAALAQADRVCLGAVHRAERMRPEQRLNTVAMAESLVARGVQAAAFVNNEKLFEHLQQQLKAQQGGVFVFLTNGSFDALPRRLAALLEP
ncbi:Mur ligase family protein [Coraliomargarita sp. SDUM461004]|uniref:Mur ligase family protein n=1 Tax=Thalassobacterium sedimentorum TaxID=3041258 RepID=A0ABU1AGG9_9BACT|nr:Mur ligase family protein [Coraliomargarita sp. SDUM461004]MDQ8192861.1 Mur ligase family protein [Coraliomargarita sp. SDUM461004]